MRRIQSEQEDAENLEVFVKVPVPKPPRTKPITIALIGALAIILAAIIPLVMTNQGSSTQSPVSTPTSEQRAQALIEQYYSKVNSKDYQDAYNLWGVDFQSTNSLSHFSAGYAHTTHDDVTINNLMTLSNGTVKADITIVATEETVSGTVKNSYQGIYILGLEQGMLKFLSGTFQKIG